MSAAIAPYHKEDMKANLSEGSPYSLESNWNHAGGISDPANIINGQTYGGVIDAAAHPPGCNELNSKTTYNQECGGWWYAVHPDHQRMLQHRINQIYSSYGGNYFQFAPVNMHCQGYASDYQFQDFHYFVIIDFEATCDKDKIPHPQEIIEFPSVIVSSITGELEACFQTYVRPTCNQLLTDFCKDLTGIQQTQVDRGITLGEALLSHDRWLEKKGIKNANFAVVTWSDWDCRVMLESECRYKKIRKPPYFNRWINLKVPFGQAFGGVRCNLKEAVEMAGLTWQGRAHSGLDDAKNTARLLALLMRRGVRFSITNSLTCGDPNHVLASTPFDSPLLSVPHKCTDHTVSPQHYHPYCFCGVQSSVGLVHNPVLRQGKQFFGCGNWANTSILPCPYFAWAST
ncbi:hypothetical protein MLD38_008836 [Melastoma candidum]|uniref:Uncharacterized protein n=1 Tax=Melastoma candidum TaxID=119954 RepID=A0ACB9RVM2_9MYRT|nr:hypothetical protein MLD38_008836 [Melastoma candidum]